MEHNGTFQHPAEWNNRPWDARYITIRETGEEAWLLPGEVESFVQGRAYAEQRSDCTIWHPAQQD
jgi:hypothetical protein